MARLLVCPGLPLSPVFAFLAFGSVPSAASLRLSTLDPLPFAYFRPFFVFSLSVIRAPASLGLDYDGRGGLGARARRRGGAARWLCLGASGRYAGVPVGPWWGPAGAGRGGQGSCRARACGQAHALGASDYGSCTA
ncbi:unnamed protein product [Dicrocoelium dendriticum]|nr:unnamed protein product [Dicrocoelium dendriticum]